MFEKDIKERFSSMKLIFVSMLIVGLALLPTRAKDGRDFAGFYDLADVSDLGETVQATFRTRIFNYSGADVTGAMVTLENSVLPRQSHGSFNAVSIESRSNAFLSPLYITLSKQEYDLWHHGGRPSLHIHYVNYSGQTLRKHVELVRKPLGEEQ